MRHPAGMWTTPRPRRRPRRGGVGSVRGPGAARIVIALVVALTSLALAGWPEQPGYGATAVCQPNAILVNPCRPWLGASANKYPEVIATLRPQIEYHEQRIGRQVDIVHAYNDPGATLTSDETYFATRPNTMLYLNWKPALTWADADGSDPATNASIDAMAQSIQALGSTKIFLAVSHEPEKNVSGSPAGCTIPGPGTAGTTDDYRAMWQNVRARFDALGVSNVVWVMNYMSFASYRCMDADLWPGNNLVDWVAFDNYGTGGQPSFVTNVGSMYDFLNSSSDAAHDYASKPYALAEWGIHGSNVTPQQTYDYSDQAKAAVEGQVFPNLKAYMVFDNSGPDGEENRVAYQNGDVYDPVRQQHYTAFADSSAFVDPATDVIPPATPARPTVTLTSNKVMTISWKAVTDNVGVTGYRLWRNGVLLTTVTGLTYTDRGVKQGGSYRYQVAAFDAAGNRSALSPSSRTRTVADTRAPSTPRHPKATSTVARTVRLGWSSSRDNVALGGYYIYRGRARIATVGRHALRYRATKLTSGRSYTFEIQAFDAAGNLSSKSTRVTVKAK